jgi:hypothetical protein
MLAPNIIFPIRLFVGGDAFIDGDAARFRHSINGVAARYPSGGTRREGLNLTASELPEKKFADYD